MPTLYRCNLRKNEFYAEPIQVSGFNDKTFHYYDAVREMRCRKERFSDFREMHYERESAARAAWIEAVTERLSLAIDATQKHRNLYELAAQEVEILQNILRELPENQCEEN